jgi:hypothetical protein
VPYFIILPALALYVVGMAAALALTLVYRPAFAFRPYVASALVWSLAGFLLSTALYAVVLLASLRAVAALSNGGPSVVGGILGGALIFVAPFIASAVGLAGGAGLGLWRALSRSRG